MCDECSYCCRPAFEAGELRLRPTNDLICSDCHSQMLGANDTDWPSLLTADDLAAMNEAAQDDKAHAIRDRRAGL
ncbi:hypothetical protein [Pseudogemmobacter faecipullorum]|uniref:Uncharacterized protein n=1 Tax=Pseudogemmobacter faecipullorum TaxID=2755041 RepID=A0ABS8CR17_9RHOB|nr:hypothetical protein [Pseudogemmobacter faecipullorum]MCB5411813.1 hypothetical protein [Pseudogemmobacter faecipullorum]